MSELGQFASQAAGIELRPMSAMPPVAPELLRRNGRSRCAYAQKRESASLRQ
jgi:hypothetical protein